MKLQSSKTTYHPRSERKIEKPCTQSFTIIKHITIRTAHYHRARDFNPPEKSPLSEPWT